MQLKWRHQFQFAGYYAAVEKGFYREAGLAVDIREGNPRTDAVEEVLSGRADFGITNSDVLLRRLRGDPVVVMAVIFQHSPLVFIATEASGIRHPQDMIGKRIGVSRSTRDAELLAMLHNEGLTLDAVRPPDGGKFSMSMYYDGTADAGSAYITNEPFHLEEKNVPYVVIRPLTYGIDFYGDCLVTSEAELDAHPDRAARFRAASLRGWEYAMAHKEEIIDVIIRRYGSDKSRAHLRYEAEKMEDLILPKLVEIGHMNPGRWRHIADTFVKLGMVDSGYSLEGFIHDPDPGPDVKEIRRFVSTLILVVLAAGCGVFILLYVNRRLRREVRERARMAEALRSARDAAEAANRAKSAFLANMSHELRTPLNSILGFSELLARSDRIPPEDRENLHTIRRSGEHLLMLINQVLDLSKIEAGRTVLNMEKTDLHALLDDLMNMFRLKTRKKGLTLMFGTAVEVPRFIRADRLKLRQTIINLLSNAVKFTSSGQVALRTMVARREGQDLTLLFEVEDAGPGIAPEDVSGIFDAFSQTADGCVAPEGTGLGLAISRHFVRLMGGDISVNSAPGRGSVFTFDIRAEALSGADETASASSERQVTGVAPGRTARRILIVDDQPENRKLLVKMLAPLGFALKEAEDGRKALDLHAAWRPDLIFMDLRMPALDGYEATRRIKAADDGGETRVIAMTANAFEGEQAIVEGSGCDGFLRKPFRRADVLEMMQAHLGLRYVYADASSDVDRTDGGAPDDALPPEALSDVPERLLAALEAACETADMDRIEELIRHIRVSAPDAADRLQTLARQFEYAEITEMIQRAGSSVSE